MSVANHTTTPDSLSSTIASIVEAKVQQAGWEAESRAYRAANELTNAIAKVLAGQRHGRRYVVPGTGRVTYRKGKRVVVGTETYYVARKKGNGYVNVAKTRKVYGTPNATAEITHKHYIASAPGEPPAVRTGAFRMSWKRRTYIDGRSGNDRVIHAVTESDLKVGKKKYLLGELLENGTSKMAPRPYKQKVIDTAYPKVLKIYKEPYFRG